MTTETAPTGETPDGATPDPQGSRASAYGGSPETGAAVEPHTPPVEPVPQADDGKKPATTKSERELQLERDLEEERSKTAEARRDAEKKRKQRAETMKSAGEFESLYSEAQQELQTVTAERDRLSQSAKTAEAETKRLRSELDGYRAAMVERFDEKHRGLTEGVPLAKLPELYEALHQQPLFQQAPPSPGIQKPAGKPVVAQTDNRFGKSRMAGGYKT